MNQNIHRMGAKLLGGLAVILLPFVAQATVITFGPGTIGSPVTSTAEGIYTYDTLSGGLFRDTQGNGDGFNMEGLSGVGGVLRIVRNDVAGGLFTFDQADVGWQFNLALGISFEGFLLGVSTGTDTFITTADSAYSTQFSSLLAGVQIDELRVTLAAPSGTASILDNVVLNERSSVPEPATVLLLGIGLAGVALRSGRRRSA